MSIMKSSQYQAYNMAHRTLAKTRQVVMLYDGAIRFIQQAKEAMTENRIADRYNLLVKASDIVLGLQGCIDFEKGGDVAKVLYDYYASIDHRILSLHRSLSPEMCDQIVKELKMMRDTWETIDREAAAQEGEGAGINATISRPSVESSVAFST